MEPVTTERTTPPARAATTDLSSTIRNSIGLIAGHFTRDAELEEFDTFKLNALRSQVKQSPAARNWQSKSRRINTTDISLRIKSEGGKAFIIVQPGNITVAIGDDITRNTITAACLQAYRQSIAKPEQQPAPSSAVSDRSPTLTTLAAAPAG
jgi:hypothetical protein